MDETLEFLTSENAQELASQTTTLMRDGIPKLDSLMSALQAIGAIHPAISGRTMLLAILLRLNIN